MDQNIRDLFLSTIISRNMELLIELYSQHIQNTDWEPMALFFIAEQLDDLLQKNSNETIETFMHNLDKLAALFTCTDFKTEYLRICNGLEHATRKYIQTLPRSSNWTEQNRAPV